MVKVMLRRLFIMANISNSRTVGEIKLFPVETPPAHTLVCNGAELSIAAYPELYGVIGTKYGGNGSTTFRLPRVEDVIYAAGANHVVGEAISEGLPEIEGTIGGEMSPVGNGFSGAYEPTIPGRYYGSNDGTNIAVRTVYFKASRSNSLYGVSRHVTPAGIALLACIVYE